MLAAIAALLATAAPPAPDLAGEAPQVESVSAASAASPERGRRFGILVDAGVPAGAGLAAMFRPWRPLRVEGGVSWNTVSVGFRGGVTVIPFEWGVNPTLHLEGGHFFDGDASRFSSNPGAKVLLTSVPVDYLSASLGLEFGSQDRFVFFLRMGLCWIRSEAQNVAQAIAAANPGLSTRVKSADDMPLLVQAPTVSVGVLLFLF